MTSPISLPPHPPNVSAQSLLSAIGIRLLITYSFLVLLVIASIELLCFSPTIKNNQRQIQFRHYKIIFWEHVRFHIKFRVITRFIHVHQI
ncbi:hypothetical protein L1887_37608 [Cichorium endivia]|nr:hypothetical protein L1887_37608 [Cichorium endivia]